MKSYPRRALLVLAIAALCTGALGACGGDSSEESAAQRVLEQTVKATSTALSNARLDARLRFTPEGLLAIGGPVLLDVKGPLVPAKGDGLAKLELAAVATVAGQRYDGGLVSDGSRAFLKLDGRAYRLDDERARQRLEALRLDPLRWLEGEQRKGNAPIGGTDTIRVTGTVDAARLLEDLDALVPAKVGERIADAVKSAEFELWTGAKDRILRQLVLRVAFEVDDAAEPPIQGLRAGRIQLRVRLDDVNRATVPAIEAPARSRPLSEIPTDRGLGGLVECLSGSADGVAALAQCVSALAP